MENEVINYPSLHGFTCPYCGQNNFKVLGVNGAKSKAFFVTFFFGAIGSLVVNSKSKKDFSLKALRYKCNCCGKKFEAFPAEASPDEVLNTPCRISYTRKSSFVGCAVAQGVWLNGVKVASIGNGKTVVFETSVRNNVVFVTDQFDAVFKEKEYHFEA